MRTLLSRVGLLLPATLAALMLTAVVIGGTAAAWGGNYQGKERGDYAGSDKSKSGTYQKEQRDHGVKGDTDRDHGDNDKASNGRTDDVDTQGDHGDKGTHPKHGDTEDKDRDHGDTEDKDRDHGDTEDKDRDHGDTEDKDRDHGDTEDKDRDHGDTEDKDRDHGDTEDKDRDHGETDDDTGEHGGGAGGGGEAGAGGEKGAGGQVVAQAPSAPASPPVTPTVDTGAVPKGGGQGGVLGQGGEAGPQVAQAPGEQGQPAGAGASQESASQQQPSRLASTGFSVLPLLVIGAACIAGSIALFRRRRTA